MKKQPEMQPTFTIGTLVPGRVYVQSGTYRRVGGRIEWHIVIKPMERA